MANEYGKAGRDEAAMLERYVATHERTVRQHTPYIRFRASLTEAVSRG